MSDPNPTIPSSVRPTEGGSRRQHHADDHDVERRTVGDPALHLRVVRHRALEPIRTRGRTRGGRDPRPQLQPAVRLRRRRTRQDAPPPGHLPLRPRELPHLPGSLHLHRDDAERVRRRDPQELATGVQASVPRDRRAARRRHPVHGGQGAAPGGVLLHVQLPARGPASDRAVLGPATRRDRDPRGSAPKPIQDGAHHRHPATRLRDPPGDPAQEGRALRHPRPRRRARVHRHQHHLQHP